jgi:uncharacterized membrane protein HdeD (DUF308 family)
MIQQRAGSAWTVNRILALVLGIIFAILGIVGFFTPPENSTGVQAIFTIFDSDTIHNILYLLTGVLGIAAAFLGRSQTFNQVFGIFYTLLGILGLFAIFYIPEAKFGTDSALFLGITHLNAGDHILHLITGIAAIIVGFFLESSAVRRRVRAS